jgi:tyrosine-protein kinase Etk/Wzc
MQAPRQSIEIGQLKRVRESSEQLYTYLEQRLQEAYLAEESETGSLRLLRSAEVPLRPVSPRPERILPLSVLLGLMIGLGAAALSARLDRRVYTPTDVTKNGFHLLSVIPDMRRMTSREFGHVKVVHVEGHEAHTNMIALLAPHTAAAEAYRHLYARLWPVSDTSGAKSIIVTSPEASVGKSTTALNLALTAASTRLRTLIVDVDMRRPAVECYLGISYRFTLQDILELPDDEDILPYITRHSATGIPNLHAITVREPIRNPLEHLVSPRLRKLVELLKQEFDIVIFDAPPLLLTSDAAFLAPLCDETIVVVAAGETDSAALHQIEAVLAECKAKLSGIVLNRFDASNRMFRSTYGYLEQNYSGYYGRAAN